jgi:V/A-type H+/Na+-transporting ATPase subunit D
MPKLNLPPTKSTLLTVRRDLAFATEGYDLLEQKRQILVLELMARVGKAREVQKEVDNILAEAHAALRSALVSAGAAALEQESLGITGTHETRVSEQRVMGLNLPQVLLTVKPAAPEFAPGSGPVQSDDVMKQFRRAMEVIGRLAEIENAVVRLSRELKKTQRRVNALEKVFLPDYRETLKYVTDVLEERERDGFVIMKLTKDKMEQREENHAG